MEQAYHKAHRRGQRRRRPLWLRLLIACINTVLVLILLLLGAGIWLYHYFGADLPSPEGIVRHRPFETTRIYARDGETLLYEIFDPTAGQRTVVPFSAFPEVLKQATIAVEDANFYSNPGVDWRGIVRAVWLNRGGEIVSGGSTITQQLVRNVLLPPDERHQRTLRRKIREAILAYRVSREFSKDQILGMYLNEIYYGNMAYGAEAAAQNYFGVSVGELTLAQAALLAGLPQAPTDLNPVVNPQGAKERQRIVLELMVKAGFITHEQAQVALAEPLVVRSAKVNIRYPHFVFYVRQILEQRYGPDLINRGGLRVVTTLDPHWQDVAQQITAERIAELRDRNASNGALVVLDRQTNQIIALVGSANYHDPTIDGQVNVALSPRQPGSALKPIVYAAAMMKGWTPATIIWDVPTRYHLGGGQVYAPRNYDGAFHGPVSVRTALANSYNIPAIKALDFVGIDEFLRLARAMGITTLTDRPRYGLSLALGSGEVTLLDLTTAYSTFANGGRARPPVALLRVENNRGEVLETFRPAPGQQVLGAHGPEIAYLITHILSDNQARAPMFGLNSALHLDDDRPAAVKTGTTDDDRDSWAIGYTPEIVVGAWVGNSDNTPMDRVPGSFGGATIWKAFMQAYHAGKPHSQFARPPGIVEVEICLPSGMLPTAACPAVGTEFFIAGSEPQAADTWFRRLRVGPDGSCLALEENKGEERIYAVLPPEGQSWDGYEQPPVRPCPPPAGAEPTQSPAFISAPTDGAVVGVSVAIHGSAHSRYTLEVGAGEEPASWQQISSGVGGISGGLLGIWDASRSPEGTYTIRLTVSRLEGKLVQMVRVRLDRTAPEVQLVAPTAGAVAPLGVPLQLTAVATDAAPVSVEFFVNGSSVGISSSEPFRIDWVPDKPGLHLLEAVATDAAGNRSRTGSLPVTVQQ